jgi:dephospho-CoA kinase
LKRGLTEFGIQGQYVSGQISHDELDAITSALVGSFFLAGKYEALRGRAEGALIIPDLKAGTQNDMVIGISGRICAGKTTAARLLEGRGFAYTRFSMVIDDEIIASGGVPDRKTRQRVGSEIHEEKGQRWLCEKVLDRVQGRKLIVIDGLRFPEDHAYFSETFGANFHHVHIVSPEPVRRARFYASTNGEPTFSEADLQPVESKIDQLESIATVVIENNGSVENFENALMSAFTKATKGGACLFQSS